MDISLNDLPFRVSNLDLELASEVWTVWCELHVSLHILDTCVATGDGAVPQILVGALDSLSRAMGAEARVTINPTAVEIELVSA